MALNFKSLLTRTLTAAVFVAVLLFCICWNYFSFSLLFLIVSIWGLHEFYNISEKLGAKPFRTFGYVSAVIIYLSAILSNNDLVFAVKSICREFTLEEFAYKLNFIGLCLVLIFIFFVRALFSKEPNPIQNVIYSIAGIAYIVLPFIILNYLTVVGNTSVWPSNEGLNFYVKPYNSHAVLGMILLIWANDSFAYLVGSMMGKRKLYERISPGKTWEGSIGGLVLTMASSYLVAGWFPEIAFKHWFVISVLVVVFGTLGDLFESLLKRQAGIKDSGNIMPGHGGILDRFDSLMFVTPFVYLYLSWVLN
jgi:phosphatidate cytidylyltransferase